MLKKFALVTTILYSLALATVCLIPIKKLPDIGVSFGDKIFHSLTYIILAFLWFNTFVFQFKFESKKAILYAAIISILFGIIIEVLQGVLTTTRQSDIFDVLANTLGVMFAVMVISIKKRFTVKKL